MRAAAVPHAWMFRTAAVVFVFFGVVFIWRYGMTDYRPELRPMGLAVGAAALLVGFFLWPLKRFAIGLSALAAVIVGLSAAVFAPSAHGPAILFLAALALVCMAYAVFAMRAVTRR